MSTPKNVYDEADFIAHSLSPKQRYGEMAFNKNGQPLGFFGIDFHCDTQARSFSSKDDDGSDNIVDYILLTHNLRFIPQVSTTWRGWDRYRLFVRALDNDASASLHQGDKIPDSDQDKWFYDETAPGVSPVHNSVRCIITWKTR